MQDERKANDTGQQLNTRARSRINTVEIIRDRLLLVYNKARSALASLGKLQQSDRYPRLTRDDLDRKSTHDKSRINDTYHIDGPLWLIEGIEDDLGTITIIILGSSRPLTLSRYLL